MTFIKSPDQANPKNVEFMEKQFDDLDSVVDKTHDLYPQYLERQSKAQSIFRRMNLMFTAPGDPDRNFDAFQKDAEELQALYEQAVAIRASMAYDSLKKTCGIDSGTEMEDALEAQLEKAWEPFESKGLGDVRGRLQKICKQISKQPVDMITEDKKVPVGYYLIDRRGQIVPHFQELEKDLKYLADAEETLKKVLGPGTEAAEAKSVLGIIGNLKAGLEQIRSVDPQAEAMREWQAQFKVNHDWRPVRLVLALAGGVFSVMGLGLAISGKGFSPATGLWMAVAVLSVRPDLLQGSDKAALESIKAVNHRKIHYFLTEKDWRGGKGRQAFHDIQDAGKENAELFKSLSESDEVFDFQIDELLGTKSGPAAELLKSSKMSNKDRAEALRLFGKRYDNGQQEMIDVALMWGEEAIVKTGGK